MGLLGRAWVSSLPNFFLGKYFHFWKLPPLFCINSRDNVYYPIFLGSIWYTVLTLEYTENCIVSVPASVKTLSQNEGFSLGKAHESVFSLSQPLTLSTTQPTTYQTVHNTTTTLHTTPNNTVTPNNTIILSHLPHDTTLTTLRVSIIKQHNTTTRKQYNNTTTHKRTHYS